MKFKQIIPFLIPLILGTAVAYHTFSNRPSEEEMQALKKEKQRHKLSYDQALLPVSFVGVVTESQRRVSKKSVGNTRFIIRFEQLVPAIGDDDFPGEWGLLDLTNAQSGKLILAGLEGRGVNRGDTLRKEEGQTFIEVRNRRKVDTVEFAWKLF